MLGDRLGSVATLTNEHAQNRASTHIRVYASIIAL
jgi:hypothetical protein